MRYNNRHSIAADMREDSLRAAMRSMQPEPKPQVVVEAHTDDTGRVRYYELKGFVHPLASNCIYVAPGQKNHEHNRRVAYRLAHRLARKLNRRAKLTESR